MGKFPGEEIIFSLGVGFQVIRCDGMKIVSPDIPVFIIRIFDFLAKRRSGTFQVIFMF